MKKIKVGLVGCGSIGTVLAQAIDREMPEFQLAALCDLNHAKAEKLSSVQRSKPAVLTLKKLIKKCDVIVECASQSAVPQVIRESLASPKKRLLFLSMGGLLKDAPLLEKALKRGMTIHAPSGAIGGMDVLKAAMQEDIGRVLLVTSKPPKSFEGAPYINEKKIDLNKIKTRTVIFEGNALDAAASFPANINVAATLSLAGIGPLKTQVKIIADPALCINVHEVTVEGKFGRMVCRTENLPSVFNPKTSALAAYSAVAALKGMVKKLKVGT